ncbi:MAG: hydroxymethylbilane synthase [Chitinophagaceae bacterium]|nr:hydroxymethylbilane synthase [Chitinophagaceae bacterium]
MSKTIRIATRSSALALWQANAVKDALEAKGHSCNIVSIKSSGDINLTQPIYTMGISGVFTKELDISLLNNETDIAVHSLKDVPTQLAEGLQLASVLPRGSHQDVALVKNKTILEDSSLPATIATSSLRRRAQWLAKYPHHTMLDIRGNVQTRLRKYEETEQTTAVIFAKAGLERLGLLPEDAIILDWIIPSPAQGIVGVVCRANDERMKNICNEINHMRSFIAGSIERQFMQTLQAGCSVPVSALAVLNDEYIHFHGAMHNFNGTKSFNIKTQFNINEWKMAGKVGAEQLLMKDGAFDLLTVIRNKKWNDEADNQH